MKKSTFFIFIAVCSLAISNSLLAQTTILSADFESGQPSGWTISTNASDGGWNFGTASVLKSNYFPIPNHTKMTATNDDACNCDKSADYIISPSMDFSTYTFVFMKFDSYYLNAAYYGVQESATIEVSTDGGNNWNVVKSLSGYGAWETVDVNLSAYAGQSNVKVAFHYNDGGEFELGWAIDDVSVYEPVAGVDMSVGNFIVGKFDPTPAFIGMATNLTGLPLTPNATIKNLGTEVITSYDISWTDGVNTYNENISGVSIQPLEEIEFITSAQYITLSGTHNITFTISNINGGVSETSTSNNSKSYNVEGIIPNADKMYLAEEGTGTWCGYCVRGAVFMEYMRELYPDKFVGIAVHNGDPMAVSAYDDGLGVSSFPTVVIDRTSGIDPSQLESDFLSRITDVPAARLTVSSLLDPSNNLLSVTLTGEFLQNLSGDYRFAAVVVEDSVHGTASGYKQSNYYSGGSLGPMGGYELLAATIPASQMYYDAVGKALLGTFDGQTGSLPANINSGDSHSYTFTYAVPSSINVNHMWVAGMIIKASTGEIVNSNKGSWTFGTGVTNMPSNASVFMYPNPAKDFAYVDIKLAQTNDVQLQIFNALGQSVSSSNFNSLSGNQILPLNITNLSSGIYTVKIQVGGQLLIKTLVVGD